MSSHDAGGRQQNVLIPLPQALTFSLQQADRYKLVQIARDAAVMHLQGVFKLLITDVPLSGFVVEFLVAPAAHQNPHIFLTSGQAADLGREEFGGEYLAIFGVVAAIEDNAVVFLHGGLQCDPQERD